jgi:hypothetical protein
VLKRTVFAPKTWPEALLVTGRPARLLRWRGCRLIRFLYARDYAREQILAWFRVLDWMLRLPEDLEEGFMDELTAFEAQQNMPYVTSVERIGIQKGRREGEAAVLLRQISLKFGQPSEHVRARIEAADADTLLDWSARILTAERVDDIFR